MRDHTGEIFGTWEIIERTNDILSLNHRLYKARCTGCSTVRKVPIHTFKTRRSCIVCKRQRIYNKAISGNKNYEIVESNYDTRKDTKTWSFTVVCKTCGTKHIKLLEAISGKDYVTNCPCGKRSTTNDKLGGYSYRAIAKQRGLCKESVRLIYLPKTKKEIDLGSIREYAVKEYHGIESKRNHRLHRTV